MIVALLLLASATTAPICIDHVHDGDTFTLCSREKIRIANIDSLSCPGSPVRSLFTRRAAARLPGASRHLLYQRMAG